MPRRPAVRTAFLALCFAAAFVARAAQAEEKGTNTQTVTGPAGAIFVDDGGGVEGLPVLLLHSFGGDSSHWASQLSHLRHNRRALAVDLRGHGKSAHPRDLDYSLAALAKDVDVVLDALKIDRVVIVGHSLGAAVAEAYAARHPKRVAGLVLVGAPGKAPPEQARQVLAAMQSNYEDTMQGYWERLVAGSQPNVRTQVLAQRDAMPKEQAVAIVRALFADDPAARLDRYPGPKLIVYTDAQDAPTELHNLRPQVPSRRIEGPGHWPHLDNPKAFNEVLDAFLATLG